MDVFDENDISPGSVTEQEVEDKRNEVCRPNRSQLSVEPDLKRPQTTNGPSQNAMALSFEFGYCTLFSSP